MKLCSGSSVLLVDSLDDLLELGLLDCAGGLLLAEPLAALRVGLNEGRFLGDDLASGLGVLL